MREIPKEQVVRRLNTENSWWQSKNVPEIYSTWQPRPYLGILRRLVEQSSVQRAVVLMGPRRVGKTVLIHHLIQVLLQVTPPRHLFYISVDHPLYVGLSLERMLELYAEATEVDLQTSRAYVFFDEIQYLKDWETHLKALVDDYPRLRFVASGSAAAALRLKSRESGAGRFTELLLPPLTFYEYLRLQDRDDLISTGEAALGAVDLEEEILPAEIWALNDRFVHYLNFGGYPEVVLSPEIQADPARFIKSDIIDKVLLRDLPSLYGIQDIQELNYLFTTLAFNTAQEVSLEELSQSSGVAKPTIKRYIEYLEAAFLVQRVHRVDQNAKRFKRAVTFKVYLTNPSIRTALFSTVATEDQAIGALAETAVFAQYFHRGDELYYARWRGGEIDIVRLGPDQKPQWAVEVKWSDRFVTRPELLKAQVAFASRNGLRQLRATTRTATGSWSQGAVEIRCLPTALHCLMVGLNQFRRAGPDVR